MCQQIRIRIIEMLLYHVFIVFAVQCIVSIGVSKYTKRLRIVHMRSMCYARLYPCSSVVKYDDSVL